MSPRKPTDPGQHLLLLARSAATRARAPATPLTRSEALAAAPWDPRMPPAWERAFRAAYADRLEERGHAKPAAKTGSRGGRGGKTSLILCSVRMTAEEKAATEALARAAGVSWSTWVRRRLAV